MAATARDVTTTAAGNNSGSNFTSACRCRCQPSSDLKLTIICSTKPTVFRDDDDDDDDNDDDDDHQRNRS